MRGLVRATHYYATQQARRDWAQLAAYAQSQGMGAQAARLAPPDSAGHKTIDKRINALMIALDLNMPFCEWQEAQP